ncbi:integrase catalytic domain-containing protein [Trichonephila inaurata madagascariensis]|uniref:Integrase catalytic domain-containing protein n=1 Tax=Trichonephila inaurata madagascariensis TaxID=2747483 RepID=A0A8X6XM77_9ARAC|nr:integrase catalytic domain-containing protein [Trichonephila inaurata madagascariensis]
MFPGKDGCTTVVKHKTTGGEIVRPVQRLFPLDLNNDDPIIFSIRDPVPSDKDIKILNSENSDCEKKTRSGRKVIKPLLNNFKTLEPHFFSDASTKAYGTVAYIRVTSINKEILTSFVASKNRIAPLKTLTLPRLELIGALLPARLSSNILKALKLNIPCFFWTDSKITYFWVRGQLERFKPFIKNRIQEIQKLPSPSNWHHCPGIQNPADIVSRGVKISCLLNDTSWLQGPEWLSLPPEFWPESKNEDNPNSPDLNYRKSNDFAQHECIIEEGKSLFDISKYSNLEKVLRITA